MEFIEEMSLSGFYWGPYAATTETSTKTAAEI